MLKKSSNLLKSTRIIANYLWNPRRCSTTDKPRKRKQEFRLPDGNPDLTTPTIGSGRRGPTLEEVKEYLRTEDKILQKLVVNFWEECKQLKEELTTEEPVEPPHGVIDMVYTFENEAKLNNFVVTTDTDHDIGHSTASLSSTSRETAIFSGFLSNKLKPDGITKYAGYVNFNSIRPRKSFDRAGYHDFTDYTHLVFKVRGDGRTYNLILSCPEWTEQSSTVQYTYPFYTRGGPYWQISKVIANFYISLLKKDFANFKLYYIPNYYFPQ